MYCDKCGKSVLAKFSNGMGECCFAKTVDGRRMARAEKRRQDRMMKRQQLQNRAG